MEKGKRRFRKGKGGKGACFICNKAMHVSQDCPDKPKQVSLADDEEKAEQDEINLASLGFTLCVGYEPETDGEYEASDAQGTGISMGKILEPLDDGSHEIDAAISIVRYVGFNLIPQKPADLAFVFKFVCELCSLGCEPGGI